MASQKLAKVVITANATTAKKVLEEIDKLVEKYTKDVNDLRASGQANSAECKKAEKVLQSLSQVQRDNIEDTKRLGEVINDLTNTKLRDLRRAVGAGKSALSALTGSDADMQKAEKIREQMTQVMRQVKLLEGEYVNIGEGIKDVEHQSDKWLDKAIKQQIELLNSTKRNDSAYQDELNTLRKLKDEEARRKATPMQSTVERYAAASAVTKSDPTKPQFTEGEWRQAINTLKELQAAEKIGSAEWVQYGEDVKNAEQQLSEILGKGKQVKQLMSEQKAKDTIMFMDDHTEAEINDAIEALKQLRNAQKLDSQEWHDYDDQVKQAEEDLARLKGTLKTLTQDMANDRLASLTDQSENSLKELKTYLEQAKAGLDPYSDEWQDLAKQIERVNQQMAQVKANTPYQLTRGNALDIANNTDGKLHYTDGTSSDIMKKDLEWAKSYLQDDLNNNTALSDTSKIQETKAAISRLDAQIKALNVDTQTAKKNFVDVDAVISNLSDSSIEEIKTAIDQTSEELRKVPIDEFANGGSDRVKELRKKIQTLNEALNETHDGVVDVDNVIARSKKGQASIEELKQAYKQLQEELEKIQDTTGDTFKDKQKDMQDLKKKIDDVTGAAEKQGNSWKTALHNLTAYAGLFTVFDKVKDVITGAIQKNFDYSASLTDIRKVSGLAMEDVDQLSRNLAKIDTRTSTEGLAELAYQGSKLGMGKYGTEGLTAFVKAADQINVAIGEEMGEEALPALSKLVETMNLIPKLGIERAMLATGSAMFKLSTTSTATSSNIVEFAKRLTGVARTAGITTDQLLALGSASDTMYLMPEVASTALGKFIVALQKNHNLIEKDLDIPDGTINRLYSAGNAMDAIVMVLEKMKAKGNMNALGGIFKDMGSDGQRLVTAMVTMSKNVNILKDHLYESQEAFEDATAVTSEYEMQQTSAIGVLERANNLWEKAFVNPEGVNTVKDLASAWYDISQMMTNSPLLNGTLHTALSTLVLAAKMFVALLPAIINFALGRGIFALAEMFWSVAKATWAACTAQTALNTAMKANIFCAIASIVFTAAGAIWSYVNAANEAAKAEAEAEKRANAWKDKLKDAQQETDTLTHKLHSYKVALEAANLSQKARNDQIGRFNKDFRQYISKLRIEIKSVDDLRRHYQALSDEIQRATYYRLREQAKQDAMPAYQKDRLAAENQIKNILKTYPGQYGGFTTKGIMDMFAKGANATWVYQQMIKGANTNVNKNGINFDNRTGAYTYVANNGTKVNSSGDTALLSALRYYQNATKRERDKEKEINDYFGDFVPDDYTPWIEEEPGTLENEAPDKDADKAAKAAAREAAKEKRIELKDAEADAKAIIDNIKNYYQRQITEVIKLANDTGMEEQMQQNLTDTLTNRMNDALANARQAIAGTENEWETFKQTMVNDLVEPLGEDGTNQSTQLLDSIQNNNVTALHQKITALSKDLNKPESSLIDQVWNNATLNEKANATQENKILQARRKQELEDNYTGKVQYDYQNIFDQFGFSEFTGEQMRRFQDGTDEAKKLVAQRTTDIFSTFETARKNLAALYATDGDRESVLTLLYGKDYKEKLEGSEIPGLLKLQGEDFRLFYNTLINYSDEYSEADKKNYERQKKIIEARWKASGNEKRQSQEEEALSTKNKLYGEKVNFGSQLGFAYSSYDPEVAMYQLKLQAAKEYYEYVMKYSQNVMLQQEAEQQVQEAQNAVTEKMVSQMKDRVSKLKDFMSPMEDAIESVGEAWGEFADSAEAGQKAMLNALKNFIRSYAQMLIKNMRTLGEQQMLNNATTDIVNSFSNGAKTTPVKNTSAQGVTEKKEASTGKHVSSSYEAHLYNLVNKEYDGKEVSATSTPEQAGIVQGTDESNPSFVYVVNQPVGEEGANATTTPTASNGTTPTTTPTVTTEGRRGGIEDSSSARSAEVAAFSAARSAENGGSIVDVGSSAVQAGVSSLINSTGKKKKKDSQESEQKKSNKKMESEQKQHEKKMAQIKESGQADLVKQEQEGGQAIVDVKTTAGEALVTAESEIGKASLTEKKTQDTAQMQEEGQKQQTNAAMHSVGLFGWCVDTFGPIAGPILFSAAEATLMGLLNYALSKIGGSAESASTSSVNTKLVSGMLTYDSGNVGTLSPYLRKRDSGTTQDLHPYADENGNIYWATEDNTEHKGVSLVKSPTATTINGQPSLVAENGPELVIGRETTKAMMQNDPDLLRTLYAYDRNHSGRVAYDAGNLSSLSVATGDGTVQGSSTASLPANGSAVTQMDEETKAMVAGISQMLPVLMQRLNQPIKATIDMYGRNQLYDSMQKATKFMKGR